MINKVQKVEKEEKMSNIPVEKKLELLKQIRSRNQRDRYDMFYRENLLYGRSKIFPVKKSFSMEDAEDMENYGREYPEEEIQTFPLRVLLALGLFLMIIVCDMSGRSFMGIWPDQCFSAISADYESSITAWVNAASSAQVSDPDNVTENPPAGSRP